MDKLRQIFDSYSTDNRPIIRSSLRDFKGEGSEGSEVGRRRPDKSIEDNKGH